MHKGKRAGWAFVVTTASGLKDGLLFVWAKVSGEWFLVDTGTEASIFAASGLITRTKQPGT